MAKILRQKQAFDYGTPEWDTAARNSVECLNHQESASRRRVRGFGASHIVVTMPLANSCASILFPSGRYWVFS
jgi:hypothetical protein